MKVGIEEIVSVFPENVVRAKDQEYLHDLLPPMLEGRYKLPEEMRRLRDDHAVEILAEAVVKKLLDKANIGPADIDYIIANNCGGTFTVPMIGGYIHHKFGFPMGTPVLNISNACASFVDGCEVAWNLVRAGKYKRILVVVVSAWETKGGQARADLTDPMGGAMGDGAGAAIVSSENLKCEFLSYYSRTWGETYDMCAADPRQCAHPDVPQAKDQPEISNYLWGTPQFFAWWLKVGPILGIEGFKGASKLAGLSVDDIELIIFHQPTDMLYDMWMDGAEKEGVSRDKWQHTWNRYGNLSNAVVPCNVAEFWEAGKFRKGMIMAWLTVGAGGHAPTMIVRWLV